MTEDSLITDAGDITQTGKQNPVAVRWAEAMTRNYEDLSRHEPVFGQLRNLMDLCVIAALIEKEQLLARAQCELPTVTGQNGDFALEAWNPPKSVATQCSFIKRGREYIITASGGVRIDSWQYASQSETRPDVGDVRAKTAHVADRWCWN